MKDYVAKTDRGSLSLYNARTGGYEKTLNGSQGRFVSAHVSGNIVHATRTDGKIETYDAEKGTWLRTI